MIEMIFDVYGMPSKQLKNKAYQANFLISSKF